MTPMVKHLPAVQETWVWSLGQEDPLEKEWPPTPVFLPGKSHGQRHLAGYSPWGCWVGHDWVSKQDAVVSWESRVQGRWSGFDCKGHSCCSAGQYVWWLKIRVHWEFLGRWLSARASESQTANLRNASRAAVMPMGGGLIQGAGLPALNCRSACTLVGKLVFALTRSQTVCCWRRFLLILDDF